MTLNEIKKYQEDFGASLIRLSDTEILITWWHGHDHHKIIQVSPAEMKHLRTEGSFAAGGGVSR